MLTQYILFLIYAVLSARAKVDSSLLCSNDFCEKYPGASDHPCLIPPLSCNKTNVSSGVYLTSPSPCNCCEFCIAYLGEHDDCSTGEKTSNAPTEMCGPGLYCDQITEKCRPMKETRCTKAQAEFDQMKAAGKIGDFQVRPQCDGDGDYLPYHCIPGGVCYCVDKNGNRIFGTVDNNGKAQFELSCECSRNYHEVSEVLESPPRPGEYFRCSSTGSYESLQCIDEKTCICVDEQDGTPIFEDTPPVEMWAINNNLPCFDSKKHRNGSFYRICEEFAINQTKEIAERKEENDFVFFNEAPSCTLDGFFASVQENSTHKFCSSPDGKAIPQFTLQKNPQNQELIANMNCNCALALGLMSSREKPSCLPNGNYNHTQYRRGIYYTVDENGNQVLPSE